MNKSISFLLFSFCLSLLLLGCAAPESPAEVPADSAEEVVSEIEQIEQEAQEEEAPATELPDPTAAEAEMEDEAEEAMADSADDAVEEDAESNSVSVDTGDAVFPAVTIEDALIERPTDHVIGADDPLITIIEYGDFQ